MLAILVGVALTAALLATLGRRAGLNAADKGSMSDSWVAANRAGERG
jgi:hypothetical protein